MKIAVFGAFSKDGVSMHVTNLFYELNMTECGYEGSGLKTLCALETAPYSIARHVTEIEWRSTSAVHQALTMSLGRTHSVTSFSSIVRQI